MNGNDVKTPFPRMKMKIGLYPIVDSSEWVEKLLKLEIKTIQLRMKDKPITHIEKSIKESVSLAKKYEAQLFVNDYWQLAIKHKAFGIHLGQEDLCTANISAIKESGIRLGISTHSKAEINKALSCYPSYIAFGPIYYTDTKKMPYKPLGLEKLHICCKETPCPVVAIGGIHANRISKILDTGVDGVAILSAIMNSDHPNLTVSELLNHIRRQTC